MNLFLDESLKIYKKGGEREENKEPGNRSPTLNTEVVGNPSKSKANEDRTDKESNKYLEQFSILAKLS
jgi:hypothetical protein